MPPGAGTRRKARTIPGVAMVGSVLVLAIVVNAVVVANQPADVTPTVRTPLPVTMSSLHASTGVTGSTIASTANLAFVTTVPIPILDLDRASPLDWNVQLVATAASGISGSEAVRFSLAGDTTQTVTVTSSATFPLEGTPVVLDADGVTISASPTSAVALCGNCAVTAELRLTSVSPSSAGLLFVYPISFDTL